ncbi:MAG: hypothetical protein J2P45_25490 [Candidatus Dormibacteraeota bacterium]|nr:hypothetical protein [Candidatus Dormibacteraeota bacterium]
MMRIAVLVEQGWDPASVELDAAGLSVDEARAVTVPTPGSLEAVEVGLGLGAVTACAVGGPEVEAVLRDALAMGAGSAVRAADLEGLAAELRRRGLDLLLASWRSGHQSPSPAGPFLGGLLGLPQATAVDHLELRGEGEVSVRRRLDRGEREELVLPLPAVLALEPGLVTPRLGSPARLLAAREVSIEVLGPAATRPGPAFGGYRAPRPSPPRALPPDPSLSAEARIAEVVGLAAEPRHRELATGAPEEVAARMVAFLEERGFL